MVHSWVLFSFFLSGRKKEGSDSSPIFDDRIICFIRKNRKSEKMTWTLKFKFKGWAQVFFITVVQISCHVAIWGLGSNIFHNSWANIWSRGDLIMVAGTLLTTFHASVLFHFNLRAVDIRRSTIFKNVKEGTEFQCTWIYFQSWWVYSFIW